jgi:hypothetical protein
MSGSEEANASVSPLLLLGIGGADGTTITNHREISLTLTEFI